jgi:hypothetical protein
MKRLGKKPKLLVAAERKVSYAIRDFEKAEAELEAFIQSGSALDYGEDFPRLIRARREALDKARDRMFELWMTLRPSTTCRSRTRGTACR